MSAPGVSGAGEDSAAPAVDDRILLGLRSFRQPAWRAAVQFGLFATVAALGLSMVFGQPSRPELGWPVAAVGIVLALLVPGLTTFGGRRRVELFEDGFVVRSLFGTARYRWPDVSDFALAALLPGRGMRQTYVVFDAAGDRGILIAINRFLSGRGRSLPIGIEPVDLPGNAVTVALAMNAWRQRALDSRAAAST